MTAAGQDGAPAELDPQAAERLLRMVEVHSEARKMARRECADELRALVELSHTGPDDDRPWVDGEQDDRMVDVPPLLSLADRWSSSGGAPAGEEEQR